MKNSSFWT